jgi:hypothetical protein
MKRAILPNEPTDFLQDFGCNSYNMRRLRGNVMKDFGGFVFRNEPTGKVLWVFESGMNQIWGEKWRVEESQRIPFQQNRAHRARLQRGDMMASGPLALRFGGRRQRSSAVIDRRYNPDAFLLVGVRLVCAPSGYT